MQKLNFPDYAFRFKNSENKVAIFCDTRKKFIILTPEEWVRQHVVRFLTTEKKFPVSHINVEKIIRINGLVKRYDVVVFNPDGTIFLLVECKAPEITISQHTFDQIALYNMQLNAQNMMVTNGINHYFCRIDNEREQYGFLPDIPEYTK
ncbi:MAG: type I restriction enzyme HsdR N-terminal domain-containing protein [Flavobacterium sp.]